MDRHRIARGWRSRPGTDLFDVIRPGDREGLWAPNCFEQAAIGPLRRAVDRTGNIGQAHFHGVGRRPLRLLGCRVAQSAAGRTHVPEIAADEIALTGIVVQNGRQRRIGMRLGLALAESCAHRTGIGPGRPVQFRHRTAEACLGHVTESASFVAIHRQMLVIQHQLAEQLDLLDLVIWWRSQPLERLRLDTVDRGLDLRNFRQGLGRKRCAGLLRTQCIGAERDNDRDRPGHQGVQPG